MRGILQCSRAIKRTERNDQYLQLTYLLVCRYSEFFLFNLSTQSAYARYGETLIGKRIHSGYDGEFTIKNSLSRLAPRMWPMKQLGRAEFVDQESWLDMMLVVMLLCGDAGFVSSRFAGCNANIDLPFFACVLSTAVVVLLMALGSDFLSLMLYRGYAQSCYLNFSLVEMALKVNMLTLGMDIPSVRSTSSPVLRVFRTKTAS